MTRRVVITQKITVGGVAETDGSWFDPTEDSDRPREWAAVTAEHATASDALLVGRTEDPNRDGTTVRQGRPGLEDVIRALTEAPGSDIVLTDSMTLAGHLLQRGLVDELATVHLPHCPLATVGDFPGPPNRWSAGNT